MQRQTINSSDIIKTLQAADLNVASGIAWCRVYPSYGLAR